MEVGVWVGPRGIPVATVAVISDKCISDSALTSDKFVPDAAVIADTRVADSAEISEWCIPETTELEVGIFGPPAACATRLSKVNWPG